MMTIRPIALLILPLLLAACETAPPGPPTVVGATTTLSVSPQQTGPRPMDEVPQQSLMPNGERVYGFASGCRIVIAPRRAVVQSEAGACELYHRDIALLYASGD
ncbi:hypothetical protein [Paracoccus shanxieyensis]|uniref:Uncharacterized protein n=1 Tax=Paracoccus shanxieyensis TaxID=2675752 RepID=A0A6L6IZ62_9RHOB|nr:hypothetical protein [Paracoccus shanxieyensis]MTH64380.1 hypothetical protein [Paracoccus shanxieyensis]MTH87627.1 hypothetical protein [Paracoccus shanxieyensis]